MTQLEQVYGVEHLRRIIYDALRAAHVPVDEIEKRLIIDNWREKNLLRRDLFRRILKLTEFFDGKTCLADQLS